MARLVKKTTYASNTEVAVIQQATTQNTQAIGDIRANYATNAEMARVAATAEQAQHAAEAASAAGFTGVDDIAKMEHLLVEQDSLNKIVRFTLDVKYETVALWSQLPLEGATDTIYYVEERGQDYYWNATNESYLVCSKRYIQDQLYWIQPNPIVPSGNYVFEEVSFVPEGGSSGQALVKTGSGSSDLAWGSVGGEVDPIDDEDIEELFEEDEE